MSLDLTRFQQLESKKLHDELKSRRINGEKTYV